MTREYAMKNCAKHLGSLALISIIFGFTSAIAAPIVDVVDPADNLRGARFHRPPQIVIPNGCGGESARRRE